jgi:hypothetical protein
MYPPTRAETAWPCGDSLSARTARNWFGWGKGRDTIARAADYNAPLSEWHKSGEPFERRSDCEEARDKLVRDFNRGKPQAESLAQMDFAACVASDDPRRKEK